MTKPAPAQHRCAFCGAPAAFGFGPPLRRDRIWTCAAHRGRAEPAAAPRSVAPPDREPDLFGRRG
ncbi:hypothetical protein ACQ5SO_17145 [Rhodovulum sp. DZ06]|uniref:hypothetical protein n=1 Tax=Rhodovulum sp. DZ06 TaxID=3425126 RepID=UPI003D32D84D